MLNEQFSMFNFQLREEGVVMDIGGLASGKWGENRQWAISNRQVASSENEQ